jgi:hypothetical protein
MASLVAVGFHLLTIRAGGTILFGNETTRGGGSCAARVVEISEQTDRRERSGAAGSVIRDARPAGVDFPDTRGPKPSIPPNTGEGGKPAISRPSSLRY